MMSPTALLRGTLPFLLSLSGTFADEPAGRVDFSRDVQPILADKCFKCHGPDASQRVSELRLDTKAGAFAEHDGRRAIVPGSPQESELHRRITSDDPEQQMPPPDSGLTLDDAQIEMLTSWISQGASWQDHWAFVAPVAPPLPETTNTSWRINPIDDFILARLESEQIQPSAEADRKRLIRRVALDLTGLPPTISEVDDFVNDQSPQSYERLVDRLLQSPRYGERMAMQWLDAARYADTSGYQNDGPRDMWRWRDWVIDAFNNNQPYDDFTIEQLAGDLLPGATLEQRIATGFNRNHRGNAEGGIIPEEFQVEYVVDRVDTTATVWLGLTLGCARCHDHKYDPVTQREFYQVFAYFNNVPEHGRAIKEGNSPPYVVAPTSSQRRQLSQKQAAIAETERLVEALQPAFLEGQAAWEQSARSQLADEPNAITASGGRLVADGLVAHYELNDNLVNTIGDSDGDASDVAAGSVSGGSSTGRVVSQHDPDATVAAEFTAGVFGAAAKLDGSSIIEAGDLADFGYFDRLSIACWVRPDGSDGTLVSRMTPVDQGDGYYLHLQNGHVQLNLVKRWLDDCIRVETHRQLERGRWHHIVATYDGLRKASGIHLYIDGEPAELQVHLDAINQTFATKQPLRIGAGHRTFRGEIDDVRVYNRDLNPEEVRILATPSTIAELLAIPAGERNAGQAARLRAFYLEQHADKEIRNAHHRLRQQKSELRDFREQLPTVMVMEERSTPRDTYVLVRGQYDKPGERVTPGVPDIFPPLPADERNNRLALARWLVSPANPLTARVAVNRFWQHHFGAGLVRTTEDFGVQGERPTHPELLDWLATEFVRSGWDMKHMHKLIVMSATYRQSSRLTEDGLARDPENRLLARAPRLRLDAETIRDQALAVSGLLTERVGGPSVKPYQPPGLWEEIATDTEYRQSQGADLYRRSLYTYWKRTVAPPMMATFDATSRESCTVKRSRTNTPLQALAVMNDVTFLEAARVLAAQSLLKCGNDPKQRLSYAFQQATCRLPSTEELNVLLDSVEHYSAAFAADPDEARQLVSVGESPQSHDLDVPELAAYTLAASLILNLDCVVTRE
ncbi:MAG: DUF1553 domain-containing protein [Planctomycetaceae bacterium]